MNFNQLQQKIFENYEAGEVSDGSEAKAGQTNRKPRQPAGDNRRLLYLSLLNIVIYFD